MSFPNSSYGPNNITEIRDAHLTYNAFTVLRYGDGHTEVIDFYQRTQLFNTIEITDSLISYFENALNNLLNAFNPPKLLVDDSYQYAENLQSVMNSLDDPNPILKDIDEKAVTAKAHYVEGEAYM